MKTHLKQQPAFTAALLPTVSKVCTDEAMKTVVFMHNGYYSDFKHEEILLSEITWINMDDMVSGQMTGTGRRELHDLSHVPSLWNVAFLRAERRMVVTRAEEWVMEGCRPKCAGLKCVDEYVLMTPCTSW